MSESLATVEGKLAGPKEAMLCLRERRAGVGKAGTGFTAGGSERRLVSEC